MYNLGRGNMPVLNIAMVGSDELAKEIAKPTDQRDVHTYVHKENGPKGARILSIIRPAKYPERLRPYLNALSAARVGIVEITAVDGTLGEALVAFASSKIYRGIAIISPVDGAWIDEEQVKMLFKQAGLGKWIFATKDGIELRKQLYDFMDDIRLRSRVQTNFNGNRGSNGNCGGGLDDFSHMSENYTKKSSRFDYYDDPKLLTNGNYLHYMWNYG